MPETDRLFSVPDERLILGKVMMDPSEWVIDHADANLRPEHFAMPAHAIVWRAILAIQVEGRNCDALAVLEHLRASGDVRNLPGGEDTLLDLAGAAYRTFIQPSVDRVLDLWKRRQLRDGLTNVLRNCPEGRSADEHLYATQQVLDQIQQADVEQSALSLAFELAESELAAREAECLAGTQGPSRYLTTGYYDLDALTQLHQGEVTVIAARPSIGKTALALNIASRVAKKGKGVLFFSLETDEERLAQNLVAAECSIDTHALRTGDGLAAKDYQRIRKEVGHLRDLRLMIVDRATITPMAVRLQSRNVQRRFGVDLIVIDYLQLVTSGSGRQENRQIEVAALSRSFKALAKELQVPVIVLAQLNRDLEKRGDGRPRLSDLRESGAIEQDADVVILMHRDREAPTPDERGITEVNVAKNRGGKTGDVTLRFALSYSRFENFVRSKEPVG